MGTLEEHAHEHRAVVKTAAEAEQTYDYIVCCHKGIDQDAIPKQISPAVDQAKSTIVIIQNGVWEVLSNSHVPDTYLIQGRQRRTISEGFSRVHHPLLCGMQ